jgi:hypothetical protein
MANRYFNKQVAESRKPLASGSMVKAISEAYKPKGEFSKKNKKSDPKGTSKSGKKPAGWTLVKPSPTTKKSRMEERMKSSRPELKGMEGFKKVPKQDLKKYAPEFKKKSTLLPKSKNSDLIDKMKKMERPRPKKTSESPERIKRQADYMKKHGKNEPRRKTLSVKNSYKKEVEGLK